jgi:hypothetical protein
MLDKLFKSLGLQPGSSGGHGGGSEAGELRPLTELINTSGRVPLAHLQQLAEETDVRSFAEYVAQPALVGWGIREGTLAAQVDPLAASRGKTMFFKPAELFAFARATSTASESLQEAIYPLVKAVDSPTREPNTFNIGRMAGNDMVMPDFAISKKHARLERVGKRYYITDLGSQNGTAVNGSPVSRSKAELNNKDVVRFARYEFSFVSPETLYQLLRKRTQLHQR